MIVVNTLAGLRVPVFIDRDCTERYEEGKHNDVTDLYLWSLAPEHLGGRLVFLPQKDEGFDVLGKATVHYMIDAEPYIADV